MATKVKESSKMKYAIKFRSILEREDITASIFASRIGFTKTRMSRILNGVIFPTVQDLEALKKVYPWIDLNEFFRDEAGIKRKKRS